MTLRSVARSLCSLGLSSVLVACGTGATSSQTPSDAPSSAAPDGTSSTGAATSPTSAVATGPSVKLTTDALQVHAALSLLNTATLTANATAGDLSAANVVAVSNGCVSTVTDPSPLNASKLPNDWSVDWTFKGCRGFAGSVLEGTANVDVDTVCSTQQRVHASVDVTDSLGGAVLAVKSRSEITVDNVSGCKDTTRVVDESGTRVTLTVDDNQVVGFKYTTRLSVTDSRDPNTNKVDKLVFNGRGKFNQDGGKHDESIIVDHVTLVPAQCCYPISGSISVASAPDCPKKLLGAQPQFSFAFGPTCGQVTADGTRQITLPACR